MSEVKDQTIAMNVYLKRSESSAHPHATNYTNVGVAQGIAYVGSGARMRSVVWEDLSLFPFYLAYRNSFERSAT
jgi:hypothetical protein